MKNNFLLPALVFAVLLPAVTPRLASADAGALADSILAAIGGPSGWEHARYFAFDFVGRSDTTVRRRTSHRWDRYTGEYRVLAKTQTGDAVDVHFNVNTRKGDVTINGAAADDTTTAKWLDRGYRIFVNDTYWLLMPFKLRDPGVRLEDVGVRTDTTGKAWRVLHLSFDEGTGMTSKDNYWVYMDPATGVVGRWDYHLQGDKPEAPPEAASWEQWHTYGPIRLATMKRVGGGPASIAFENVTVAEKVPPDAFRGP